MSMFINTNVAAINSHRNLAFNNTQMGKTMEKLSSGYRINRAADDAAGLAISEKMRFQINGLNQAQRNAQDGISLLQTAEGALTEVHSMLQRMNTLANQASNGTYNDKDRSALQAEVTQLLSEINNIANTTNFNGIKLLNVSAGATNAAVVFQVGVNKGDEISVNLTDMRTNALGSSAVTTNTYTYATSFSSTGAAIGTATTTAAETIGGFLASVNIATDEGAKRAIGIIEEAINQVSEQRGAFGAVQNRLEHTINNLGVTSENLSASESRVRNADMAKEMTEFTRNQILVQAGTSMLAQANSMPQNVLKLLG
jgi:Flagellin and related hook-associated proteins